MRAALGLGASMINDVNALSAPGALEAVASSDCGVCLMHKKGEPATMQRDPHYEDVVREVRDFLDQRIGAAMAAGVAPERIVVDPGFGFGKTASHNLVLLKHLRELSEFPLLVGLSRKSTVGRSPAVGRGAPCREPRHDCSPCKTGQQSCACDVKERKRRCGLAGTRTGNRYK
jgi:dihydropteroate synthase